MPCLGQSSCWTTSSHLYRTLAASLTPHSPTFNPPSTHLQLTFNPPSIHHHPQIQVHLLAAEDQNILLVSDGMLDLLSPQDAACLGHHFHPAQLDLLLAALSSSQSASSGDAGTASTACAAAAAAAVAPGVRSVAGSTAGIVLPGVAAASTACPTPVVPCSNSGALLPARFNLAALLAWYAAGRLREGRYLSPGAPAAAADANEGKGGLRSDAAVVVLALEYEGGGRGVTQVMVRGGVMLVMVGVNLGHTTVTITQSQLVAVGQGSCW